MEADSDENKNEQQSGEKESENRQESNTLQSSENSQISNTQQSFDNSQQSKVLQKSEFSQDSRTSQSSSPRKLSKTFKVLETQGIFVGKTLGGGSYAKVKCAFHSNRNERVALKIIHKKKSISDYLTTFLPREIEAMRILGNHYALIRFYQIIETTNHYFFVMELADGGDLLSKIKLRKYIEELQAGQWFVQLYDGIKYMHLKGIVHRDIKCENLLLDSKNRLKITDFGFCKKIQLLKNGCSPELSETYCGSYAYAPPEILRGTAYNPELSDIWSMGVVLFTMLYGRLPFDDRNHKVLLKQVHSKVLFPSKPTVSEEGKFLITKILTKSPERMPLDKFLSDSWFKLNVCVAIHNSKKSTCTDEMTECNKQEDQNNDKITGLPCNVEAKISNDDEMKTAHHEEQKSSDLIVEQYKLQEELEQKTCLAVT